MALDTEKIKTFFFFFFFWGGVHVLLLLTTLVLGLSRSPRPMDEIMGEGRLVAG